MDQYVLNFDTNHFAASPNYMNSSTILMQLPALVQHFPLSASTLAPNWLPHKDTSFSTPIIRKRVRQPAYPTPDNFWDRCCHSSPKNVTSQHLWARLPQETSSGFPSDSCLPQGTHHMPYPTSFDIIPASHDQPGLAPLHGDSLGQLKRNPHDEPIRMKQKQFLPRSINSQIILLGGKLGDRLLGMELSSLFVCLFVKLSPQ